MKYPIMLMLIFLSIRSLPAQNADVKGNAAYLFAYYPKEDAREQFENGYKKHLSWHEAKKDPLVWYAWYVQTGDRLGLFIDGTFGISHMAFDNRIAPTEDGQDFQQTTAPFANNSFRKIYTLKSELSTVQLLEDHTPSKMIEVFEIVVDHGQEAVFEKVMQMLKVKLNNTPDKPLFTVYKLLSGGEQSGYMIMVPREKAADFDKKEHFLSISQLIVQNFSEEQAQQLNQDLSKAIKHLRNETWAYRSDMSRIPE